MSAQDVRLRVADGETSAYLAVPPAGRGPGVLILHEIFGVNRTVRALADAWAARGYVALAPDLFWRQEPGVELDDASEADWKRALRLNRGFDDEAGVGDLRAALVCLRRLPECTGRAGTLGFCLGGRLAYLMAIRSDADANVGYYGVGIERRLDEADKLAKPLLLHVAGRDPYVPQEARAAIRDRLRGRPGASVFVYPTQDHGFARVGSAHHDPEAAALADRRTERFFAEHLRASSPTARG